VLLSAEKSLMVKGSLVTERPLEKEVAGAESVVIVLLSGEELLDESDILPTIELLDAEVSLVVALDNDEVAEVTGMSSMAELLVEETVSYDVKLLATEGSL